VTHKQRLIKEGSILVTFSIMGRGVAKRGKTMDLEQIKYQTCSWDDGEGILLTDIDEAIPETDEDGNLQYYCLEGNHTFSAYEDDES